MNLLFFTSIVCIYSSIRALYNSFETCIFNLNHTINKCLHFREIVIKDKEFFKELEAEFKPLVTELCKMDDFEINKRKVFYNKDKLVSLYIQKIHKELEEFKNYVLSKNMNNLNNVVMFYTEKGDFENDLFKKIQNFLIKFNDIYKLIKEKMDQRIDRGLDQGFEEEDIDEINQRFVKEYVHSLIDLLRSFKSCDIMNPYISLQSFGNTYYKMTEFIFNVVKKFYIEFENLENEKTLKKNDDYRWCMVYFKHISEEEPDCADYKTVQETLRKIKYVLVIVYSIGLFNANISVSKAHYRVIDSLKKFFYKARKADYIDFINRPHNSDRKYPMADKKMPGYFEQRKGLNKFISKLNNYFQELDIIFKNNTPIPDRLKEEVMGQRYFKNIPFKILERHLTSTGRNSLQYTLNAFEKIKKDDHLAKNLFSKIYFSNTYGDLDEFVDKYFTANAWVKSCHCLMLVFFDKDVNLSTLIAEYLEYKNKILYQVIELINKCLNKIYTLQMVYKEIKDHDLLRKVFLHFTPRSFCQNIYNISLYYKSSKDIDISCKNFELFFESANTHITFITNRIEDVIDQFVAKETEEAAVKASTNFMSTALYLITYFTSKLFKLINNSENNSESSEKDSVDSSDYKTVLVTLVFEVLKVIAANAIEERNWILNGMESDFEFPDSVKKMYELLEKFVAVNHD